MEQKIRGKLFGLSQFGKSTEITLVPKQSHFSIIDGEEEITSLPYSQCHFSWSGFEKNKFTCPLEIDSHKCNVHVETENLVEALKAAQAPETFIESVEKNIKSQPKSFESVYHHIFGFFVILALLVVLTYVFWPTIVKFAVSATPISFDVKLGKLASSNILLSYKEVTDPEITEKIEKISQRLTKVSIAKGREYRFIILDADMMNAFALPDGRIYLFKKLIFEADSETEVAGVMAHEMAHVIHRHSVRNLYNQLGVHILISLLTGSDTGGSLSNQAEKLTSLSFSRAQEDEADRTSVDILVEAQIDPHGMKYFFEKLMKDEFAGSEYFESLSTHPNSKSRIDSINTYIGTKGELNTVPLDMNWSFSENVTTYGDISIIDLVINKDVVGKEEK